MLVCGLSGRGDCTNVSVYPAMSESVCIYIYVYIQTEREREREGERFVAVDRHTVHMWIYVPAHVHIRVWIINQEI